MITKKTSIAEMNEVIARFDGYEKVTVTYFGDIDETEWQRKYFKWMNKVGIEYVGDYIVNVEKDKWFKWNDVAYHRDWEWLMSVVEKIENVALDNKGGFILRSAAQVKIYYQACRIIYTPDEESGDNNEEIIIQTKGRTKIEAVHKAVFKFIQWFNQQHKTNDK